MFTNTAIVVGAIVVLVIGGILYFTMQDPVPSPTATSTPTTIQETTETTPDAVPQAGAPRAITSQTAVPSDSTAVVLGTVTPNGAFTNYWYEFGPTQGLGSATTKQSIGSGFTALPATAYITGLTKDTTYFFRLHAQNQFGIVNGSTFTFRTTVNTPAPVGSAPAARTLAASLVSRTSASVNGEVTPNRSNTQFWFEYGDSANLGNTTALSSAGNGTAKVPASLSLSDLAPSTTYFFRLNAQNQFGTVNGAIRTFKTAGPASNEGQNKND